MGTIERRTLLANALVFSLGVGLAVLVVEGGIRLVAPQRDIAEWFTAHEELEFTLKPDYRQSYTYPSHGFTMEVRTNSDGFRDDPWDTKRAVDGERVLILGDSFAFGYAIDVTDRFDVHAKALLDARGYPAAFFNTGVPGWGTSHQVRLARSLLGDLAPDAVVLLFCPNDPANDRGLALPALPDTQSSLYRPKMWLRRYSHAYRFALERYGVLRHAWAQGRAAEAESDAERSEQTGFYISAEDWARTAGWVEELRAAVERVRPGAPIYILSSDPLDAHLATELREIAERVDAMYIDIAAPVSGLPPDERRTPWDPHWSPAVHAIAGHALADALSASP